MEIAKDGGWVEERMRKHRGWSKEQKKWIWGAPLYLDKLRLYKIFYYYYNDGLQSAVVEPESIGQEIGLKDNDGKMIWEGDILEIDTGDKWPKVACVKYELGAFITDVMARDFEVFNIGDHDLNENSLKIIGNKFENPELLEDRTNGN